MKQMVAKARDCLELFRDAGSKEKLETLADCLVEVVMHRFWLEVDKLQTNTQSSGGFEDTYR